MTNGPQPASDNPTAPQPSRLDIALPWLGITLVCLTVTIWFSTLAHDTWPKERVESSVYLILVGFMMLLTIGSGIFTAVALWKSEDLIKQLQVARFDKTSAVLPAITGGGLILVAGLIWRWGSLHPLLIIGMVLDGIVLIVISIYAFRNAKRYGSR